MNRKLTLILALLLAAQCLPACGGDPAEDVTTDTVPTAETTTAELVFSLPEKDFGGAEFNILVRTDRMYYLDTEQSGDVFDDAVFDRNREVEELYNVKLNYIDVVSSRDNFTTAIQGSVMAGDGAYDLVMPDYNFIPPTSGLFLNLLDFDCFNFDREWWSSGWNDNITFDGRLYSCVGDYCLDLLRNTHVVYFSKDAIAEYKLENPYDLVRNGSWTHDKMHEMGQNMASDLNSDGIYDENDAYTAFYHMQTPRGLLISCGEKIADRAADGSITTDFDDELFYDKYEKLYKLWKDNPAITTHSSNSADFTTIPYFNTFNQGRMMFVLSGLFAVDSMRTSDTEFGIVPTPKYNEAQERYYAFNHGCSPCSIIKTAKDPEMSAYVLEALNYLSSDSTVPCYYDQVLKGKVARDSESAEMLDLIFSNVIFDFTFINSANVGSIFNSVFGMNTEDISSAIASLRPSFEEAFRQFEKELKEME